MACKVFLDKHVLEGNFILGEKPNKTRDAVCYDKHSSKHASNFWRKKQYG